MSEVSLAAVRALIQTSLSDLELQTIIDRMEQLVTSKIGAVQNEAGTVEVTQVGAVSYRGEIFTGQPIQSITSLSIGAVPYTVEDLESAAWSSGYIHRITGTYPADSYVLVYKPVRRQALFESVIIDLVRLELSKTAMKSENVAGEYSYQAPDWQAEQVKIMRRIVWREF